MKTTLSKEEKLHSAKSTLLRIYDMFNTYQGSGTIRFDLNFQYQGCEIRTVKYFFIPTTDIPLPPNGFLPPLLKEIAIKHSIVKSSDFYSSNFLG